MSIEKEIQKLKRQREQEAKKFKVVAEKAAIIRKKKSLQNDIRRIRKGTKNLQLGKTKKTLKTIGKSLFEGGKILAEFSAGVSEEYEKRYVGKKKNGKR